MDVMRADIGLSGKPAGLAAGAYVSQVAAPSPHDRIGPRTAAQQQSDAALRQVFDAFVGETFFSQMLAAMRRTLGEPSYMHGGQAERVFQGQLDQHLAERLARASAGQFSGKMFELFQLQRPGA